jgi:hypothetical protein
MSSKLHENVRVKAVGLITWLLRDAIRARYEIEKNPDLLMLDQLLSRERIDLLMPQEVYVSETEKKAVDMLLGGQVVFEFKSYEQEFDAAVQDATSKYWPVVSRANFYILTNWSKWRIYRVRETGLEPITECGLEEAKEFLKTQVIPQIRTFKIPPLSRNIEALYKLNINELLEDLRNVFSMLKNDSRISPLYEAYKGIMRMLYGEAGEEFFEDLFIRHTYMHMAVLASLSIALEKSGNAEDICSGSLLNVDVALPYLNWWRVALRASEAKINLIKVLNEIIRRASLVDWSQNTAEDVFRTLYEFLVEPPVRRRLGEYYTPPWLVEMIVNEFDVKNKIVLDPFCGSGTFLVRTFHRKIELNEKPDEAFGEVVGFDVNPLAVAVARAEMVMAYKRSTGKEPDNPPHVYHIDTFATLFGEESIVFPGLKDILEKASSYLEYLININAVQWKKTSDILASLRTLEKSIALAIRFAYQSCGLEQECVEREMDEQIFEDLKNSNDIFIQSFLEHFRKDSVASTIANLIHTHQGNDVWSTVLMSVYTSLALKKFKADIIVTNPPWIPVTEYNAPYSEKIRENMSEKIKECIGKKDKKKEEKKQIDARKTGQLIAGADIASAGLARSLELANEGVAFIMNRDQLFNHKTPIPAGIVATYCIVKSFMKKQGGHVKLFDFDFDVFEHGIYPAVIVVKKMQEGSRFISEANVIKLVLPEDKRYSKRLKLDEIKDYLMVKPFNKSYDEYIKPGLLYFTEDLERLAEELGAEKIYPMGLYIRGLLGGEKKKSEEEYAGLVLDEYNFSDARFVFRLHNTNKELVVPRKMLDEYGINIYKLVYVGEINPFRLRKQLEVLISSKGEESLKNFLRDALSLNERYVTSEIIKKIERLSEELKQPGKITTLNTNKFYVAYRCDRIFSAFAFRPEENTIVDSHVSYIECKDEISAYYYSAILNYLAFKVISKGRAFIRHQFARPLLALYLAGFSIKNIDDKISMLISELSKKLHEGAPHISYDNQRIAFMKIAEYYEFKEIVKMLDSIVDRESLEEALELVSSQGSEADE